MLCPFDSPPQLPGDSSLSLFCSCEILEANMVASLLPCGPLGVCTRHPFVLISQSMHDFCGCLYNGLSGHYSSHCPIFCHPQVVSLKLHVQSSLCIQVLCKCIFLILLLCPLSMPKVLIPLIYCYCLVPEFGSLCICLVPNSLYLGPIISF